MGWACCLVPSRLLRKRVAIQWKDTAITASQASILTPYSLSISYFPTCFEKRERTKKNNIKIQYVRNEDHLTISIVYKNFKLFASYRAIVTHLIYL